VNADHATQLLLLDLQAADTALAQLAHRRRTLPEVAQLADRAKAAARLHDAVVDARTALDDIADEQRRLENDVETVRTRTTRDEARLQAGGLPARELEGLQHEIVSLARRQSTLEDELLDVMERAEQAESALAAATSAHEAVLREQQELTARRDEAFAEIDAALAARTPERAALAARIPADVLSLYDRAQAQSGIGAALLRHRRCDGCHMELSGTEMSALHNAADDAIVRCENCRTILVRTGESGL
jgi:uncharacterized protein